MICETSGLINTPVQVVRRVRTGGDTRIEKNALPRAFLLHESGAKNILGAFIVVAAYNEFSSMRQLWHISLFVGLITPFVLAADHYAYRSTVAKLTCDAETEVRLSPATVGGNLNHHFLPHARSV